MNNLTDELAHAQFCYIDTIVISDRLRDRSLFMWGRGVGGGKSWGESGLFFSGKRGGRKENFMMVGGESLCVL